MKINLYVFYILLFFQKNITNAFINKNIYTVHKHVINNKKYNLFKNNLLKENINIQKINKKKDGFLKLIRYKNIPSTLLLSISSGFIINNSILELFQSKMFIASSIITILIMSSSMIINDIFDISIDKINNANRPLVNGDIKFHEAIISLFLLLGLTEYLSIKYLINKLQIIVNIAILTIILYTPLLKKILFIKNLTCSSLISFSTYFSALSLINDININKNIFILFISSFLIFLGSLYNEILLDISDYDGDKLNKINTIPVVYGLNFSWKLTNFILKFNIFFNSLFLMLLFNFNTGVILLYILYPLVNDLNNIKKYNYNNSIIRNTVNKLEKPLFLSLIYLCSLSCI
jgi:4-hydroxybenzoate polyprenyltransferase